MLSRRPVTAVFVVMLISWTATSGRTAADDFQVVPRAESPTFEVALVKPTSSGPGPVRIETLPGGRFVATNVTLRALIQNAYRLQPFQVIGGPAWSRPIASTSSRKPKPWMAIRWRRTSPAVPAGRN